MRNSAPSRSAFPLLLFLWIGTPVSAWAYVDPGSVTILVQVAVAFLLGGIFAFRDWVVGTLKSLRRRFFGRSDGD